MNSEMFKPCMKLQPSSISSQCEAELSHDVNISCFDAALVATETLFRHRIHRTASKRDRLGVLLYGTRKKPAYMWQVTGEMKDAPKPNTKNMASGKPKEEENISDSDDEEDIDEEEEEEVGENDEDEDESSDPMDESDHTDDYASINMGVCTLLPLQSPSVEAILRLRQCLPTQSRLNNFYLGGTFVTNSPRTRNLEEELVGHIQNGNDSLNNYDGEIIEPSESFVNVLRDALSMFQEKRYV